MSFRKLWIALGLVLVISFAVLGGVGIKVLKSAPPIPSQVVTTDGRVLFDGNAIHDGQGAWQSIGGQEVGTIWGHGAYIAPTGVRTGWRNGRNWHGKISLLRPSGRFKGSVA